MVGKEFCYLPIKDQYEYDDMNNNISQEDHYDDDDDYNNNNDEDDALSFCDLPIYSDASADWSSNSNGDDDYNNNTTTTTTTSSSTIEKNSSYKLSISRDHHHHHKEDHNSSTDFFEFFSSEFTVPASADSSTYQYPESIVFCGKLIIPSGETKLPPRPTSTSSSEPPKKTTTNLKKSVSVDSSTNRRIISSTTAATSKHGSSSKLLQRWIPAVSSLRKKPKPNRKGCPTAADAGHHAAPSTYYLTSADHDHKLSRKSSSKKSNSRLSNLFLFGLVKLPGEMELADIKSRQGRRNPTAYLELYEEEYQRKRNINNNNTKLAPAAAAATTVKSSSFVGLMRSLSCRACRSVDILHD